VFVLAVMASCGPPAPVPARSVLFVLVDALRRDHVGVYGRSPSPTPTIDTLSSRGAVFDHAIAASAWTRSSIAAMFASRFPTSLGVLGRDDAVPDAVVMLPEVLRERGFRTLGVWSNANANHAFGFAQGFDDFRYPDVRSSYPGDFVVPTAEGVTRKALELVDTVQPGQRFFLFAHYVDAHDPYLPHADFASGPEPPGTITGSRHDLERLDAAARPEPGDIARVKFLYRNAIAYCDHWIGELINGLRTRGLDRDLLVVVTADHGEGLWDHGVRGHGRDLYGEMTGVPLVMALLSRPESAGVRVAEPVSLVDLAPTILSAAGLPAAPSFSSGDLAPFSESSRRRVAPLYSEVTLDGVDLESIRSGPFKLIRSRGGSSPKPTELFDLSTDPGERTTLVSAQPERTVALTVEIATVGERLTRAATPASRPGVLDRQSKDNLRALGYLGGTRGSASTPSVAGTIDFRDAKHPARQLLTGFFDWEQGRRWMGPHAEILLGRTADHRTWTLTGEAYAAAIRRPLSVVVRANSAVPQVLAVPAGRFTLSGPLPDDGQSRVRLVVDCSASFVPAREDARSRDVRELCLSVYSIGLAR
jgi:arylsulfatase A-like enzyme